MFQAKSNQSIFKHLQNHLRVAGRLVHHRHEGAHNLGSGVVHTLCYTCLKPNPIEAFSKPYFIDD